MAERPVKECKASISGLCLALSMGFTYCSEGECTEHEVDLMVERARELAKDKPSPKRAVRRARRVQII